MADPERAPIDQRWILSQADRLYEIALIPPIEGAVAQEAATMARHYLDLVQSWREHVRNRTAIRGIG